MPKQRDDISLTNDDESDANRNAGQDDDIDMNKFTIGARVVRGKDWKWDDQDANGEFSLLYSSV